MASGPSPRLPHEGAVDYCGQVSGAPCAGPRAFDPKVLWMMRMGAMSSRPITPEEPTASQQQQRQQRQRQQRQHQLEEASEEGGKPATPSSVPPPSSPEDQPTPGADGAGENPEGVEGTPSIRGHVEPSSFSSTASSSASLSRGGAAAAPRKEPTLGARPPCNKPVLRDHRKGKGKVKAFAVARKSGGKVGGGGGAGAGGGGGGSGSGAKGAAAAKIGGGNKKSSGFGHGKRPRAGQSHNRARKDGTGDEVNGQHRFLLQQREGGEVEYPPLPSSACLFLLFGGVERGVFVSREPPGVVARERRKGGRAAFEGSASSSPILELYGSVWF